mmetsp:Transcript_32356/g.102862  ORF Transcript_32356/g.102862 Transcript_32356/m.102862 type:complete len:205 (+) Transcript_32356:623-1237(+)
MAMPLAKRPALKKYGEVRPDLSVNSPKRSTFSPRQNSMNSRWYGSRSVVASAALPSTAALAALILSRSSRAAAAGSAALLMPRLTGTSRPMPCALHAALTASSRLPPWAPMPGARIHVLSPAAARARRRASTSVAPTTSPSEPRASPSFHAAVRRAVASKSASPAPTGSTWKSLELGLLVLHSTKAPLDAYSPVQKGFTASQPM